jgi:hypothetical protein
LPDDPPPPAGLTLDHLELLTATFSIHYKQALKKFNEGGCREAKKKKITKDEVNIEIAEECMVMHIRDVIAKAGSFDRFRKIVKRATGIEGGGGKSSTLEERKVRGGGVGPHVGGINAAANDGGAAAI